MTIAVDFDGVIVRRRGFPRPKSFENDPPMKGALRAISWLVQNHYVYILTSRPPEDWPKIEEWLTKHHFPTLEVTNTKKQATIYLDDRAVRFTDWMDFTKYIA